METLIKLLEPGKSYVIFYTPRSGFNSKILMQMGEGLKDCTVFMQPVLELHEIEMREYKP